MQCPVDNELLQMTERSGVEIDYCPRCRGIWLDRGELDKILERAERELRPAGGNFDRDDRRREHDRGDDDDWRERSQEYERPRKKRKSSSRRCSSSGTDALR